MEHIINIYIVIIRFFFDKFLFKFIKDYSDVTFSRISLFTFACIIMRLLVCTHYHLFVY